MSYSNNTTVIINADIAKWSFTTIGKISIATVSLILNFSMLLFFVSDRRRITAFTVYLICLLTSNVLFLSCWGPLNLLSEMYPSWWMGHSACAFLNYMNFVFSGCVFHTHCLITINRIWAIRFPVSYRNHHNKKVALGICLGIILFDHVFSGPAYFIGLAQHRDDTHCGVYYDQQPFFAKLQHIAIYQFALFFVAIGYFYLLRMVLKKKRPLRSGETSYAEKETSLSIDQGIRAIIRMTTLQLKQEELSVMQPPPDPVRDEGRRNGYEAAKPFVVLTLSTISIVVCWTPVMIHWLVWLFVDAAVMSAGYYHVAMLVYSMQAALDPVWFAFSLRSVQEFLRKRFRWHKRVF